MKKDILKFMVFIISLYMSLKNINIKKYIDFIFVFYILTKYKMLGYFYVIYLFWKQMGR